MTTNFFSAMWPLYEMMGRWGEGWNQYFLLAFSNALALVETNFTVKGTKIIVLELIFISDKRELIVTIFFTITDIRINI